MAISPIPVGIYFSRKGKHALCKHAVRPHSSASSAEIVAFFRSDEAFGCAFQKSDGQKNWKYFFSDSKTAILFKLKFG